MKYLYGFLATLLACYKRPVAAVDNSFVHGQIQAKQDWGSASDLWSIEIQHLPEGRQQRATKLRHGGLRQPQACQTHQ